jgi:hypothetical protein
METLQFLICISPAALALSPWKQQLSDKLQRRTALDLHVALRNSKMYWISLATIALIGWLVVVPVSRASGLANQAFGFNSDFISGFPGGRAAEMTGGGAFNLDTNFFNSGGGFRCLADITGGPFNGCLKGEGVRWDTSALLPATMFQCTGSDPAKLANTDDKTVVLLADFYRQGDGNVESFTAKMIVSELDLASDIPGDQNVWIQGIGCGSAIVSFH